MKLSTSAYELRDVGDGARVRGEHRVNEARGGHVIAPRFLHICTGFA
jgi:hypothetical protein